MIKNTAGQTVGAQLVSKTDGSAVTTGTTDVYVTGDAGTQALSGVSPSGAVHKGNGYWAFPPSQAETNYNHVAFTFVNSSAVNVTIQIFTSYPQTGDNYPRLGAPAGASVSADIAAIKSDSGAIKTKTDFLPSATAGAAGGVFIAGTNAATSITTALTANVIGNVTGNLSGSVGSVTGAVGSVTGSVGSVATGGITAASFAADAITAAKIAADVTTELQAGLATASAVSTLQTSVDDLPTNAELATALGTADDAVLAQVALVKTVTDKLNTTLESVGSPGQYVFTVDALAQGPSGSGSSPSAIADEVQTRTIAGVTTVGTVNALAANSVNASALAADAVSEIAAAIPSAPTTAQIADKFLGRNIAGGSDTGRTVSEALMPLRNKTAISGGTMTVYEEDDSTPAWTAAVTTTPGDPLSAIDPA